MTERFTDKTCALCRARPSTPLGEHAWPRWYFKDPRFPQDRYVWTKNGKPVTRRDDVTPVEEKDRTRVRLPVCKECNAELDRRFEHPSKHVLRRLFAGPPLPSLTAGEVEKAALWLLKTWLLLSRPDVEYAHDRIYPQAQSILWAQLAPPQFYRWLVNNDPPPEGLSLWLHRSDDLHDPAAGRGQELMLPTVHEGGHTVRFESYQVRLHGLSVVLALHPRWPIDHPLEASGQAVRLWPHPPAGFDFNTLAPVPPSQHVVWCRGLDVELEPGALNSGLLPALSAGDTATTALLQTGLVVWSG